MSTVDRAVSPPAEVLEAIIGVQQEVAEAGLGLDHVMRLVTLRAQELTGGTGALVEEVDGDTAVCRAANGSVSRAVGQQLPANGTLSRAALRAGRSVRSDDVEQDPNVDLDVCRRLRARSLLVAPVRARGPAGVVIKVVSDAPEAFDQADGRTLELLSGLIAASMARESGEQVRSRQELLDPLTGLASRALFLDRLRAAVSKLGRHPSTVAVLSVDLDGFKDVNDALGREAGDRLLVAVAGRIKEIVRGTDTVARLGGDDFALVCEDAGGPRGAAWVAERIVEWLARPFRLDAGREVQLGATIGIAVTEGPNTDPKELLRHAGQAMYAAKADGRGGYRFAEIPAG